MSISRKTARTELLMNEALLLIEEGKRVIVRVKGSSMLPFLRGDKDSVELEKASEIKCGDIVLAYVEECRFVLHRIIRIDGERVVLMGDGNLKGCEYCRIEDIKAKAVNIIKPAKGGYKKISCTDRTHMRKADLWKKLLPVRRYILAIYKRIS
ncbi:MAG: S24/S26 family peptidase [Bacteroidales bacterium]|nr:S24/S26 family peptidase [Bacteroidales bacterium]MBQ7997810.1 S24/S26 family peptidase [Bacteroidales bacterium]